LAARRMCRKCGEIFNLHVHEDMEKCISCWWELYQRVDDKDKEAIEKRIKIYEEVTMPVINYLDSLWLVKKINWDQDIEKVFQDIEQAIS
jgi:adenylate kinase